MNIQPRQAIRWIICDLDNCLSNDERRVPLIDWTKPPGDARYVEYHRDAENDPVNEVLRDRLLEYVSLGARVCILTARPMAYGMETARWMAHHSVPYHMVLMRPDGDMRKSVDLKRDLFEHHFTIGKSDTFSPGDSVYAAFDDHQPIVDMYREFGVDAERVFCHEISAYEYPETDAMPEMRGLGGDLIITDMNDPRVTSTLSNLEPDAGVEFDAPPEPRRLPPGANPDLDALAAWGAKRAGYGGRAVLSPEEVAAMENLDDARPIPPGRYVGGLLENAAQDEPAPAEMTDYPTPKRLPVAEILRGMAATFEERNAVYGDNYKMVAKLVAVLFPNGVPPELVTQHQWHLFELILVKLSRFAITNLSHVDSIHDAAVYGAMIEAILTNPESTQ